MSFIEVSDSDKRLNIKEDEAESDFGEFFSASPDSNSTANVIYQDGFDLMTDPSVLATANEVDQLPQHKRLQCIEPRIVVNENEPATCSFAKHIRSHETFPQRCQRISVMKPFGAGKNSSTDDVTLISHNSHFKDANKFDSGISEIVSDTCSYQPRMETFMSEPGLNTKKSCIAGYDALSSATVKCDGSCGCGPLRNCHSWSAGVSKKILNGGTIAPVFPDIKSSLKHANGLCAISGLQISGLTDSNLNEMKPVLHSHLSCSHLPRQDYAVSSSTEKLNINSDTTQESNEFNNFQSVSLTSDSVHDEFHPTGNQNGNWASFDDADLCVIGENSGLAVQDYDVSSREQNPVVLKAVDSNLTVIPPNVSADAESNTYGSSKEELTKLLKLAFPSHVGSLSAVSEEMLPAVQESYSSDSYRPDLLQLIGEPSFKVASRDKHGHPSDVSHHSLSVATWDSLKVMEDTHALKFHWNGSHANNLLLKSVAMKSPSRLSGRYLSKPSVVRASQGVSDHLYTTAAKIPWKQPHDSSSSSPAVLSVSHLRK